MEAKLGRLISKIVNITSLSKPQIDEMHNLFCKYFDNASADKFERDLKEKEWVILLTDKKSGRIQGFSTQMVVDVIVDGLPVKIVFSGDTIIDKEYWGEPTLAKAWLNFFYSLANNSGNKIKLYWFLITMGYKTYRFLPVYFKQFYPCVDKETPLFEKRVIDTIALSKFPNEHNQATGVIKNLSGREILRAGVADINPVKFSNPHVRYFVNNNPEYMKGDELACLALIDKENLKSLAFKVMGSKTN